MLTGSQCVTLQLVLIISPTLDIGVWESWRSLESIQIEVSLCTKPAVPVIYKDPISVDLVLQGEIESEVFNAFIVMNLYSGGVLVSLKVLDDIWEPHRQPVVPEHSKRFCIKLCYIWSFLIASSNHFLYSPSSYSAELR